MKSLALGALSLILLFSGHLRPAGAADSLDSLNVEAQELEESLRLNFLSDFRLLATVFHPDRPRVGKTPAFEEFQETARAKDPADAEGDSGQGVAYSKDHPYVNSLAMKFVPVPGTDVLFSIWETRVGDFDAFVKETGYDATKGMYSLGSDKWKQRGDSWRSPGFAQTSDHPVCGVSWEDATNFCRWLSMKEGRTYRLPTDAEWSKAVGLKELTNGSPADKDRKIENVYPWGTQFPPPSGAGNFAGSEARDVAWPSNFGTIDNYRDGYARTSPVGSFKANELGLYDLGGNVWEWCEDWYDRKQKYRLLRGGSWQTSLPRFLLSSYRRYGAPGVRGSNSGFRCVVVGVSAR